MDTYLDPLRLQVDNAQDEIKQHARTPAQPEHAVAYFSKAGDNDQKLRKWNS